MSLSLGFSLTLIALLLFVGALRLDRGGGGRIWPFSFAEILMYLALSQVLAGGFQYLATGLLFVFHNVPQRTLLNPEQIQLLMPMAEQLTFWLILCAGVGWLASIYAAPIYFLIRNPLPGFAEAAEMARDAGPGESSYTEYDRGIAAEACKWLKRYPSKIRNKPWALFVSFVSPHYPLTAPPRFFDLYAGRELPATIAVG